MLSPSAYASGAYDMCARRQDVLSARAARNGGTMDAMSHGEHRIETARLRRSPRYGAFFVAGGLVGVLAAVVLTLAFAGSQDKSDYTGVVYSTEQVLGFVALICIPVGLALGGLVALLFDRAAARRSREVRIDRETVTALDDPETPAS